MICLYCAAYYSEFSNDLFIFIVIVIYFSLKTTKIKSNNCLLKHGTEQRNKIEHNIIYFFKYSLILVLGLLLQQQ